MELFRFCILRKYPLDDSIDTYIQAKPQPHSNKGREGEREREENS
jgi:hypothetical protein